MLTRSIVFNVATLVTFVYGQDYSDTLSEVALTDLSAILAAYDVADYSSSDYEPGASEYYEEVGPISEEFSEYPTGFDSSYFVDESGRADELLPWVPEEPDYDVADEPLVEERGGPFNFDFDYYATGSRPSSGRPSSGAAQEASEKLAQSGEGSHAGTTFNHCRLCRGQSAAACAASSTVEECNDAQMVCEVTVRVEKRDAEPLYWSGCKAKRACAEAERQNFISNTLRFQRCKSTAMARRFFDGSTCTFCSKLGTAADHLLFRDVSGNDNPLKILVSDGTSEINIEDALRAPHDYFRSGGVYHIYDSQTWYSDVL